MRRAVMALLAVTLLSTTQPNRIAEAQSSQTLYRATLVQAAPGNLLLLIEQLKQRIAAETKAGEPPTWMIRHSQGDAWDLLLLTPIGGYDYFSERRASARERAQREAGLPVDYGNAIAWQEDVFVFGPTIEEARAAIAKHNFFHVEMFIALAGKHAELRREREMENAYQRVLGRPQNMIFTRDMGAAWDSFTIGAYRDLKHYAESADIPTDKQEEAAAGFQSAWHIGPYLRTLIRSHHDTLATAVR